MKEFVAEAGLTEITFVSNKCRSFDVPPIGRHLFPTAISETVGAARWGNIW
jgi:hypothetical protein